MSGVDLLDRFSLVGRRALVTGGSIGIGRAIALGLAQAGADVAIQCEVAADQAVDRSEAGDDVCAAIKAMGRRSHLLAADFAIPNAARRVVEGARAALGGLDVLVIAASVQHRNAFEDVTREAFDHQVAVNLAASVELFQAALPLMAEQRWGRVLSIGSVNQTSPDPELAIYAALKAAQHNLIINLARYYAPLGVTLNTLSPGLIATDRNRWRREGPDWSAIEAAANPMGRAGLPEEMVGAALLLCSDAATFITGADFQATGGGHL
jgi:NAD(P)-dependent dehydrogenase (short-subunit alcohol dehydrogenase family)